jgi:hypothetical protein
MVNEKQGSELAAVILYLVDGILNVVVLFPSFVDAKPHSVDDKTKRERFTDI